MIHISKTAHRQAGRDLLIQAIASFNLIMKEVKYARQFQRPHRLHAIELQSPYRLLNL